MNPADLRADMPALDDTVYLNTGASGPSPRRVVSAATDWLEHHEYESPGGEGMYEAAWAQFDRTREDVADFVGADAEEIALTQSTADGIARVSVAIDWERGDRIVRTDLEHAAGILPWRRLEGSHGVAVDVLETDRGRVDMDAVKDAVAGARLLFVSALDWCYGTRLPVSDLVDVAHDAGARVVVDAVQVPGQVPMDVEAWGADVVAAASHKWLLGPWGAGFLYVADADDWLEPTTVGYRSVEAPDAEEFRFKSGAQRFEVGTTNPAPYAGASAAIETVESVGLDTVQSNVERLTDRLKDGLGEERVLSPPEYESGLVTFTVDDGTDADATVERLADASIRIRSLPLDGTLRASIHVFNTESDVDALLDAL